MVDPGRYHSKFEYLPIRSLFYGAMGLLRQAALKNGEPTLCTSFAVDIVNVFDDAIARS